MYYFTKLVQSGLEIMLMLTSMCFQYKTLARSIMKSRVASKVRFQDGSAERDPCYSCEGNLTDPTTPTPLLAAEFTNGNVNGFNNSHPLKDVKYNARRHMSAPNTAMTSVAIV